MAEYEGLDLSEMQKEYDRLTQEPSGGGGGEDYLEKFVRLPERDGFTLVRILPKKKGVKNFYCATRVHTLNNPSTGKKRAYHCPKALVHTDKGPKWQGDCIICKFYSDLWQRSEGLSGKAQEDLQNQARAIKPVERYYYNVIVRSEKDKNGEFKKNVGPKIYSCGKTVHAKVFRAIFGDETAGEKGLGDITHPMTGRDFRIVKKVVKGGGGSEYPNYDNSKFEDVTPAGAPDDLNRWIENLNDLQALRIIKTEDELKHALKIHLGMIREGGETQDSDLDEFRNAGSTTSSNTSSAASEPLREDLVASSVPSSEDKADEEILADEDFMKDLANM